VNRFAEAAWREGIAPLLSDGALSALATALATDDERLVQGATTIPVYLPSCTAGDRVERACPLGWCCWHEAGGVGRRIEVRDLDERFGDLLASADHRLGQVGAVAPLIEWIDGTGRDELLAELLAEVRLALEEREQNPWE